MKGKLGVGMLVLGIISFLLYKPIKPKTDTGDTMTVSGIVVNEENKPVSKVAILLQGTSNKVFTNREGEYTISGQEGGQFTVSHPKYRTQEVPITGAKVNIHLLQADSAFEAKVKADFPDAELIQ